MHTHLRILLSVLCLSACAGRLDTTVRTRAAGDLSCPADKLVVREVEGREWDGRVYEVSGCDRSETLIASCFLFCAARTPAEVVAEEKAEARRLAQANQDRAAAPPGKAGPVYTSVSLENLCSQKVLLFRGREPRNSGGRSDSIGARGIVNMSGTEGDKLWITDEKGYGISSFTFNRAVRKLYVTKSCMDFSTSR